jgi:hypothetical protein
MKIYKLIFLVVFLITVSCSGTKNYTLEDNKVKVVRSSMSMAWITPNSGRIGEEISVLKEPLLKLEIGNYSEILLPKISKSKINYYVDTKRNTVNYRSTQTYAFDETDLKIMHFDRRIKPKKDKFYLDVFDFKISGRSLNLEKFVFTVEDFKYDFSLLKIKKDHPLLLISIQFLEKSDGIAISNAPILIIPYKIGDPNWLKTINYQNYYSREFDKENFEHLEVRIKEIYLDNITTAEVDAITNAKTKDLPEVLKAIADLIRKKESLQP